LGRTFAGIRTGERRQQSPKNKDLPKGADESRDGLAGNQPGYKEVWVKGPKKKSMKISLGARGGCIVKACHRREHNPIFLRGGVFVLSGSGGTNGRRTEKLKKAVGGDKKFGGRVLHRVQHFKTESGSM